jgi:hypothetical protein
LNAPVMTQNGEVKQRGDSLLLKGSGGGAAWGAEAALDAAVIYREEVEAVLA